MAVTGIADNCRGLQMKNVKIHSRRRRMTTMRCGKRLRNAVVLTVLWSALGGSSQAETPANKIGPQTEAVDTAAYQHVLTVAPEGKFATVSAALGSIRDASESNHYAVLVAAGHYMESGVQMKPYVDLF